MRRIWVAYRSRMKATRALPSSEHPSHCRLLKRPLHPWMSDDQLAVEREAALRGSVAVAVYLRLGDWKELMVGLAAVRSQVPFLEESQPRRTIGHLIGFAVVWLGADSLILCECRQNYF